MTSSNKQLNKATNCLGSKKVYLIKGEGFAVFITHNVSGLIMLKKNLDRTGRVLRGVIASLLLIDAWWFHSWVALLASLFVFFEAYMSWCVFYQLIGKNSCPIETISDKKGESVDHK